MKFRATKFDLGKSYLVKLLMALGQKECSPYRKGQRCPLKNLILTRNCWMIEIITIKFTWERMESNGNDFSKGRGSFKHAF